MNWLDCDMKVIKKTGEVVQLNEEATKGGKAAFKLEDGRIILVSDMRDATKKDVVR